MTVSNVPVKCTIVHTLRKVGAVRVESQLRQLECESIMLYGKMKKLLSAVR